MSRRKSRSEKAKQQRSQKTRGASEAPSKELPSPRSSPAETPIKIAASQQADTASLPASGQAGSPLLDEPQFARHVVGVGASAGGLEAIEDLFDQMPVDSGLAFVVVQHLSPDFKSLMDQLLARHTKMAIHRVEDGMAVEPNAVYLIPPKKNIIVSGGRLLLTDQERREHEGINLPIDIFFRSLAEDYGERAVGVILSGTGSDGSRGVQQISEAGGTVIVQDPDTAKFDGMPQASLATGAANEVLSPDRIAAAILPLVNYPVADIPRPPTVPEFEAEETDITKLFRLLNERHGIDFAHYKTATVTRRLERRMTMKSFDSLAEYARRLESDPVEMDKLYRDLLVEVTHFFRDPESFERLEQEVLPQMVEAAEESLRFWVPGCATGEEAYSLAILLDECLTAQQRKLDVKVFATDVHQTSLDKAAAGVYDESALAEVSDERRERYFIAKDGRFQILPKLRQMVVVAPQNLTKDPPFTKLDLVSCRNVLIYLVPEIQRKIVSLFHFSLKTKGVLCLGPSESMGEIADEFDVIDSRWKVFRKRRDVRLPVSLRLSAAPVSPDLVRAKVGGTQDVVMSRLYESMLNEHMPASLLVNERQELLHVFGDVGNYLRTPTGKATLDALQMVDENMKVALSSALHRAAKDNTTVSYRDITTRRVSEESASLTRRVGMDSSADRPKAERTAIKLTVTPMCDARTAQRFLLISFEEMKPTESAQPAVLEQHFDAEGHSVERIVELEQELEHSKENLQATIEELETSNEELQSTNEELVASNEELQSTNEELHSVNEELYTVNTEHQNKIEELTELTNDMDNLLRSTEIGTVFLDATLHIRKFTPAMTETMNLLPRDLGRPIEHLAHNIDVGEDSLIKLLRQVLQTGRRIERAVTITSRTSLLMRVLPYRTDADAIVWVSY